jgi:hypothetical protein
MLFPTPSRTLRFSKTWQCVWHEYSIVPLLLQLCMLTGDTPGASLYRNQCECGRRVARDGHWPNGSLVTVQVERENVQTVFDAEQQCKGLAALQRNWCLQDLLGRDNDPVEQDAAAAAVATAGTALVPCLLHTALQPRLAPTTLLTGLLALV